MLHSMAHVTDIDPIIYMTDNHQAPHRHFTDIPLNCTSSTAKLTTFDTSLRCSLYSLCLPVLWVLLTFDLRSVVIVLCDVLNMKHISDLTLCILLTLSYRRETTCPVLPPPQQFLSPLRKTPSFSTRLFSCQHGVHRSLQNMLLVFCSSQVEGCVCNNVSHAVDSGQWTHAVEQSTGSSLHQFLSVYAS